MNEKSFDLVVIGTGPSGVAAAREACIQGLRVLIVDAGLRYSPADSVLNSRKEKYQLRQDFPTKKYFGSEFATRKHPYSNITLDQTVGCVPSAAVGGLSSIWGGCVIPLRESDAKDWPYNYSELLAGYEKVFQYIPLSGAQDWPSEFRPAGLYPQASPTDGTLRHFISQIGNRITSTFDFRFMESLLAVDNKSHSPTRCIQCGKCLSGCEANSIFRSSDIISSLQKLGARYISGLYVTHLEEDGQGVRVVGSLGPRRVVIRCSRVAVAAGPISSTALALSALSVEVAELRDSQAFTLPMLVRRNLGSEISTMSLPTNFVEAICRQTKKIVSHMQIYPHGQEMKLALDSLTGIKFFDRLVSKLAFPHAVVAHGFLDSSNSGRLQIRKLIQSAGDQIEFSVTGISNPNSALVIKSIGRQLSIALSRKGIVPLTQLAHLSKVGGSFHIGASFPVSRDTGEGKSDSFGRPYQLNRIHLVDASSMPSIPPHSPTLTAMAHAHILVGRIARGLTAGELHR